MKATKKRTRKEAFGDSDPDFEANEDKKAKDNADAKRARVPKVKENHEETKEAAKPEKVKVEKIISDYQWKVHPTTRNAPQKTLD